MIKSRIEVLSVLLALGSISCARDAARDSSDAKTSSKSSSPGAIVTARPGVPTTQIVKQDPCSWISAADVARALGDSSAHAATRVLNAENAMPSEVGSACRYELGGKATVAIEVIPDETGTLQGAFAGMSNVEEIFGSTEAKGDSLIEGRWDFVSVIPGGLIAAKKGRIGIQLVATVGATDRAMKLASAIVDGIPDLPFTQAAADPNAPGNSPDPCALITRQEAEALIGPLATAPFRSRKSTALVHGAGPSCTYFTGKHRALVITPTLRNAAMLFNMLSAVSGMVANQIGGAAAPDTLDGPWDQLATGTNGSLNLLKNDKMLSMQFQSSAADYATAIKLARLAIPRL